MKRDYKKLLEEYTIKDYKKIENERIRDFLQEYNKRFEVIREKEDKNLFYNKEIGNLVLNNGNKYLIVNYILPPPPERSKENGLIIEKYVGLQRENEEDNIKTLDLVMLNKEYHKEILDYYNSIIESLFSKYDLKIKNIAGAYLSYDEDLYISNDKSVDYDDNLKLGDKDYNINNITEAILKLLYGDKIEVSDEENTKEGFEYLYNLLNK